MSTPQTASIFNTPAPTGAATAGVTIPGTTIDVVSGHQYHVTGGFRVEGTLNWGELQAGLGVQNGLLNCSDTTQCTLSAISGYVFGTFDNAQNTDGPTTDSDPSAIVPLQLSPAADGDGLVGSLDDVVTVATDGTLGWCFNYPIITSVTHHL